MVDAQFSYIPAQDIAGMLFSLPDTQAKITGFLREFIAALYRTSPVEAVAFLAVSYPLSPTTLSTVVFTPLERRSEIAVIAVDSVTTAEAQFADDARRIIHTGLSFVNTRASGINLIKQRMIDKLLEDESVELLKFITFRRR